MFDNHLFISYAHLDNLPLSPEEHGWVTRFHGLLDAMLGTRLGRKPAIWRDLKLTGTDIFGQEIVAQFAKTALLISVVSPRYIQSEWCRRELQEFCAAADRAGGLVVDNKSRVIKVIKIPVESEASLPAVMTEMLGYEFYDRDEQQRPFELDGAYGPQVAQRLNVKVATLAWDISQQLRLLERAASHSADTAQGSKPIVYLAETSWDQRPARETVAASLRQHGYTVLPDVALPRDEASYVDRVSTLLSQCQLSVHLVGQGYGAVPDGPTQKSVIVLQNELAAARAHSGSLTRVIWVPEALATPRPEQAEFIEQLLTNSDAQYGADVFRGDLETLKIAMHDLLERLEANAGLSTMPLASDALVYLLCERSDVPDTIALRKALRRAGLDVEVPNFTGSPARIRQDHQERLAECAAVIVYYGRGDESWKRAIDSDLRKMAAYRRGRTLPARYTFLAAPTTDDKADLIALDEPGLVNGLTTFPEADVATLAAALRRGDS